MVKKIFCLILSLCILSSFCVYAQTGISADAAVVIDADTLAVLYEKNAHKQMRPASTTKIMTALLALEDKKADTEFEVDGNAIKVEGTSMGLVAGDKVTLKKLAWGMLLLSGNDAANAAAVRISGTAEAFAEKMNERAAALGLKDTHFVTPSGLDASEHYTSAYDLALLAAEALKNESFAEICNSRTAQVEFGGIKRTFKNHNRLLWELDGCIGVKTGFTKKAGRCLVSAVKRSGRTLICVTLKAPDDWRDHKSLYAYAFSLYSPYAFDALSLSLKVKGGVRSNITAYAEPREVSVRSNEKIEILTETDEFLNAPIYYGQTVGRYIITADGKKLESGTLTAQSSSHLKKAKNQNKRKNLFEKLVEFVRRLCKM